LRNDDLRLKQKQPALAIQLELHHRDVYVVLAQPEGYAAELFFDPHARQDDSLVLVHIRDFLGAGLRAEIFPCLVEKEVRVLGRVVGRSQLFELIIAPLCYIAGIPESLDLNRILEFSPFQLNDDRVSLRIEGEQVNLVRPQVVSAFRRVPARGFARCASLSGWSALALRTRELLRVERCWWNPALGYTVRYAAT
jgi:hypothetical protein